MTHTFSCVQLEQTDGQLAPPGGASAGLQLAPLPPAPPLPPEAVELPPLPPVPADVPPLPPVLADVPPLPPVAPEVPPAPEMPPPAPPVPPDVPPLPDDPSSELPQPSAMANALSAVTFAALLVTLHIRRYRGRLDTHKEENSNAARENGPSPTRVSDSTRGGSRFVVVGVVGYLRCRLRAENDALRAHAKSARSAVVQVAA